MVINYLVYVGCYVPKRSGHFYWYVAYDYVDVSIDQCLPTCTLFGYQLASVNIFNEYA